MPFGSEFLTLDFYRPLIANAIRIGLILLFAYICSLAIERMLRALRVYSVKMMLRAGSVPEFELQKRAETIAGVMRKVMLVMIWIIAAIMILREMNFDVRPLLAGAGIIGVAIGFGAQSVVKDVLSGLFMLMENQLRINDVAVINGKSGLVEEMNLRTTVLRGEDGAVHIFPNGNIKSLSNMTREFSFYVITVSVTYQQDSDQVVAILKEIGDQLMKEEPYRTVILAPLEVMGVDQLGAYAVQIKVRFKTLPNQQWSVGREMNRRIQLRFNQAQIEVPFPTQTVQLALSPEVRQELKRAVKEVLDESRSAEPRP